jgi:hypothetical protein
VSGGDAAGGELPGFCSPGRDGPDLDEHLLDALLAGQQPAPDAPGPAAAVAEMLASLAGPAPAGPLTGEDAARSAFGRAAARPLAVRARPGRRQPPGRPGRLTMKLAAGLAAVAAGLSATAAAYEGALPGPVQDLAHIAIGAPAARVPGASGRHQPGPVRPGTRPARRPHRGRAPLPRR